jgi:ubiquinone/menaquinone biosynthesis C-methylase UbiE
MFNSIAIVISIPRPEGQARKINKSHPLPKHMDIKKQYETIGKDYLSGQNKFFSKTKDEAIKFIQKCLPNLKDKNILDLGCGNGKDIKLFESLGAKSVYGIDSSKFMINEAKKSSSNPKNLFIAEIEKTPFEDKFFDIIIGRYSLHYLEQFDRAYEELFRILKPKGILILVVDHPLKSLMSQKKRVYGNKEIVKIEVYDNKVPIHFPSHTLGEYFSKTFFNLFYLDYFEEGYGPEMEVDEYNTPDFMGIKAIKK